MSLTRALQLAAAAVAAVTFTLSFYGLNDFAARSMGLPAPLSWLVPLGLDGLTLVGIAATFMLRQAPLRVRAYAWTVFGVAASLSMAGNHQHAVTRQLDGGGVIGFTVAPAILALAAHLVVVTWRNLERAAVSDDTASDSDSPAATPPPPPPPPTVRKTTARRADKAAEIRAKRADGMQPKDIAAELRVSERTVWRHCQPTDKPTAHAAAV